MKSVKENITALLRKEGFAAVGFAPPKIGKREQRRLAEFIANGEHGTMEWVERHLWRKQNPKRLMASAKTVIVVAMSYAPAENPLPYLQQKSIGNISVYARNADYHDIMKKRLRVCAKAIAEIHSCTTKAYDFKFFVDTAPIAEKPIAANAHIGWQGKHTNLVSREFGSWLFLGEILTDLNIPTQEIAHEDLCGSCRKCLDICPTNAFPKPYQLDARRCISYLTIEHKGAIPQQFRSAIGNRIYGCDDCLAVCPWNKFARQAQETAFHFRKELNNPPLKFLLTLNEEKFRKIFTKSPIKRIGYERFMRNVLIAAGNSKNKKLLVSVKAYETHASEVIAEAAQWAEAQITQ